MSKTFEALQKAEKAKMNKTAKHPNKDNKKSLANFDLDITIAEELKNMKLSICSKSAPKTIRTILFTSSNPGEGTSTILFNFAKEIALSNEKVIIVDTNLRTPVLHKLLNVENTAGIAEILGNKKTIAESIKKTGIDNLLIVPCGNQTEVNFSVFSSEVTRRIIKELSSQADWVLFDSPPVNKYSDAAVLAEEMDGVIMVIQAEKTKWEVSQIARDKISKGNAQILGAILNKKKFHIPSIIYKLLFN